MQSTLRRRSAHFTLLLLCAALTASAKDEPPPARPAEIRIIDAEGRVLLSRGGVPFAVAQVRSSPAAPEPVLSPEHALKAAADSAPIQPGREEIRQFKPANSSIPAEIMLRARKISSGARLLFMSAAGDAPRAQPQAFPNLQLAIQIFPTPDKKAADIFYADGARISPEGLAERRARSWSMENDKGFRVSIARSAPADWKIARLGESLLLTAELLPDPRSRTEPGAFVVYLGSGADEGAPELSPLKIDKRETPARDFIEGAVRVYVSGANPYVLSEAAVVAEVACPVRPDGEVPIKRLPCFFWEGPPGSPAEGEFRFRFAPPGEGVYAVRIAVVTGAGQVRGDAEPFRAGPPASPGSAKTRAGERLFRFDDGSVFKPIAVQLPLPEKKYDSEHFRKIFIELGRNGINAARLPLYAEQLAIESPRAGEFDRTACAALDDIFRAAQARDIQLIVCLENGTDLRERSEQHIYFREKGGPLAAVPEFFRDVNAKKLYQNRLTYLAARYGAYRAVLSWELMDSVDESWPVLKKNPDDTKLRPNEADLSRRARRDVQAWAGEMALHMKGMDQHEHLVCVSTALGPAEPWVDLEHQEHLDWIFMHGALSPNLAEKDNDAAALIRDWAVASREPGRAHKPVVLASYGNAPRDGFTQHNAIFSALSTGLAGTPLQPALADPRILGSLAAASRYAGSLGEIARSSREELRSFSQNLETRAGHPLRLSARVAPRGIAAWIQDPRASAESTPEIKDAEIRLPGLIEGVYHVRWLDTWSGEYVHTEMYSAPPKHVDRPLEPVLLRAPAFKGDIVVLIVPEK